MNVLDEDGLTEEEQLELKAVAKDTVCRIHLLRVLDNAVGELATEDHEQCQGCHLCRETRNHDVDAHLVLADSVGTGRDRTAGGLQEQGEEITADEDDGIEAGPESGDAGSEDDDDPSETEIDGSTEERGSDGEAHEVHQEGVVREGVGVHLNSTEVTEDFENESAKHAGHKAPRLVLDTEAYLDHKDCSEDGEVEGVAGKVGHILEMGL